MISYICRKQIENYRMAKRRKTKKKPATKRVAAVKTRNSGTLTDAAFFQMLRSVLRARTRFWKPIQKARDLVRRPYRGPNKRQKWEYKCSICENYFNAKEIEVHHTIPAGKLSSFEDLPGFAERLFAEEGYVVNCKKCHKKFHDEEKLKI